MVIQSGGLDMIKTRQALTLELHRTNRTRALVLYTMGVLMCRIDQPFELWYTERVECTINNLIGD